MEALVRRAETLIEALPYIRAFQGKTLVIKYGGAAMEQAELKEQFAQDVVLLRLVGIRPVIVHGGGPQIGALMKRLGKEPRFVGGMRVTDEETMEIVEMVLVGKINKEIVGLINLHGGRAVGLSGKDGEPDPRAQAAAPHARRRDGRHRPRRRGRARSIPSRSGCSRSNGFIPVIAPVGVGRRRRDLQHQRRPRRRRRRGRARRREADPPHRRAGDQGRGRPLRLARSRKRDAERLIKAGVIDGGMLPKVESSLRALGGGAPKAHIIDGRVPHAILLEVFTAEGIGTEIIL